MDRAPGEAVGPEPDDLETLLAAREGSHSAGERLVRRYGPSMMRTAWSVAGRWDTADVEDAVQEAFIAALTTPALPHGDVGAWLRSIAVRKALDHARRTARRGEQPLGDGTNTTREPEAGGSADAPVEVLAVRGALARLGAADRAVLTLVDIEGFSMREAAAALGATTVAVKWRAVRARRRLRVLLESGPPLGEGVTND